MTLFSRIGTCTLTNGIITIDGDWGWRSVSLKFISGKVTYQGTETINTDSVSISSSAETLDSSGFEMVTENPVDGFIIDASAGSVIIAFVK